MISEEKNIYVGVITITCIAPKSSGIQKQKYKVGYVSTTDSKKQRDESVALHVEKFKQTYAEILPDIPMKITGQIEVQKTSWLFLPDKIDTTHKQ